MPYIDEAYIEQLKTSLPPENLLERADEDEQAFKRVLDLASRKEQSSVLLRARLLREEYSPEATEYALNRALECGLIDDNRYASALVRGRLAASKGMQGIERELEQLDITASLEQLCPDQPFDDEWELERALGLLYRKPPTAKNKREAAYRRLLSKGYASSIASRAARVWHESIQP